MDDLDRLVFCSGLPKSGTTHLQVILNMHPDISCPSECHLSVFLQEVPKMFELHNQKAAFTDQHTVRQGYPRLDEEDAVTILQQITLLLARKGAQGRNARLYGLKDNRIITNAALYGRMFPGARFVFLVRDPRAIAVSSWYENTRIAPQFEEQEKNLETWSLKVAEIFRDGMGRLIAALNEPDLSRRSLVIRFEDLVQEADATLDSVFAFLGVARDADLVAGIAERTSFEQVRDGPYFRSGTVDSWTEDLGEARSREVLRIAGEYAARFDYS